jgi:ribulose-phosphate 3-epimerase
VNAVRRLLPSILAADFAHLAQQVQAVEQAGADMLHVDIMDGHFVPSLTMGPWVVEALRRSTRLPMDVHLMVARPQDWVEAFIEAGASAVSFHVEAYPHWHRLAQQIRKKGALVGIALNPGTPLNWVESMLEYVDYVVVMTVNPGWGGQTWIEGCLEKVRLLRDWIDVRGFEVLIEVDGGIHEGNVAQVVQAGANWIVAGSAIFRAPDPAEATRRLKQRILEGSE